MVQAQAVRSAQITEQESLQLTRNLLRIAVFNISYIRGLFPEKYFDDKYVPALEMKIKKLMPLDPESRRLIDWMEKGVYDALQKKYLRTLIFGLCDSGDGALIEEYTFSFTYGAKNDEVSMDIARNGDKKGSKSFTATGSDVTPAQMKSSACKMVRTLVQLMRTLDGIPEERTIIMKLLYYDENTPSDYEPPFFRCCSPDEQLEWSKTPLKMKVGDVNSKHYTIALKVRSVLDPCEGNNEARSNCPQSQSHGSDAGGEDTSSDSGDDDDDVRMTQDKDVKMEDSAKNNVKNADSMDQETNDKVEREGSQMKDSDAETEDEEYESQSFSVVKEWVLSRRTDTIDISDVMASFPEVSTVLIEDLMERLVKDGTLKKLGQDLYHIIRKDSGKKGELTTGSSALEADETETVNKATEPQGIVAKPMNAPDLEGQMYTKALFHALQLEHVTIATLQNKLGRDASFTTTKKLLDRMVAEGYLEQTASNRRMGRRVLHTRQAELKLKEVTTALDSFTIQKTETIAEVKTVSPIVTGPSEQDTSTVGRQQSYGSENTRHGSTEAGNGGKGEKADFKEPPLPRKSTNGSAQKEDSCGSGYVAALGHDAAPAGSCSTPGPKIQIEAMEHSNSEMKDSQEMGTLESSQRIRKASVVLDPIYQTAKRFRSEV